VARNVTAFARSRPALQGLVLLSCHADVIGPGLLEPDWVFDCGDARLYTFSRAVVAAVGEASETSEVQETAAKRRRTETPRLTPLPEASLGGQPCAVSASAELVVRRALPCEWAHFREHHYKDHRLQSAALCFVGELEGRAVAFLAAINPGFNLMWTLGRRRAADVDDDAIQALADGLACCPPEWCSRMILREHRTVVLPDSQGLGLGAIMADAVAHICEQMGYVFMSTTAHPTYGGYRDRSPLWAALPSSQRERPDFSCSTFSHIWIGSVRADGTRDPERERLLRTRVNIEGTLVDCMTEEQLPSPVAA
jgi:GNAT superfamily N-acetyltransferase